MFDQACNPAPPGDEGYLGRAHRALPEPLPVWVRCDLRLQPRPSTVRGIPLWLRAYGIDVGARVPGLLRSWHLLHVGGEFWGLVDYAVGNRNGTLRLELTELLPSAFLSPREPGAQDPWAR